MNVNNFIEEFLKVDDKESYVASHIITYYANYEDKIAEAKRVIELSFETEVDGKKKFYINTPQRYVLFVLSILKLYTDITFDPTNIMIEFNLLEKNGVVEMIRDAVGADYERYSVVVDMVQNDYINNNRDLVSFIEHKVDALEVVLTGLMGEIEKVIKEIDIE